MPLASLSVTVAGVGAWIWDTVVRRLFGSATTTSSAALVARSSGPGVASASTDMPAGTDGTLANNTPAESTRASDFPGRVTTATGVRSTTVILTVVGQDRSTVTLR